MAGGQMKKVMLAIPLREAFGQPCYKTQKCIEMIKGTTRHAVEYAGVGGQQISQNSKTLCEKFLEGDWDYLLYTGDDIVFPPQALDWMIARDKDFVSGVCTWKTPPYKVVAVMEDERGLPQHVLVSPEDVKQQRLREVDGVGSGFILVKRCVLEGVRDLLNNEIYPSIPEEYRWLSPLPFFPATWDPITGQIFSSDFAFSKLAKMAGFRIFLDCAVICRHRWQGEYDVTNNWEWVRKYGETREEEAYYGHNPGFIPLVESDYYWGPQGPPVPITATSVGNTFHLQEHIRPIMGCQTEPITTEGKTDTDVGYVVGWHVGEDMAWHVYTAWCKRFKRVIVHWVGTDVLNIDKWATSPERIAHMNSPRFVHVVDDARLLPEMEPYFGDNVQVCHLPTRYAFPVMELPGKFRVGVYYPKHRHDFYYGDVLKGVIEAMPDVEFNLYHLFGEKPDFEYPNMRWLGALNPEEYAIMIGGVSCVLRLTKHDGRPFSIMEAAMMGRRFVTNFDIEGTHRVPDVPTVEDVVAALREIAKETAPDEKMAEFYRQENDHLAFKKRIRILAGIDAPPRKPYDYTEYWEGRYANGELGAGGPEPGGREADWVNDRIRRIIAETDAESVLDIGCGSMARWKELPVSHYTGVDISQQAVNMAAAKFPDGEFFAADLTVDTLPRSDVVTAIDVLPHIKPEDFPVAVKKIFNAAAKAVVLKVAFGVNDGYYQYNVPPIDDWNIPGNGIWTRKSLTIPGNNVAKLWVFVRKEVPVASPQ